MCLKFVTHSARIDLNAQNEKHTHPFCLLQTQAEIGDSWHMMEFMLTTNLASRRRSSRTHFSTEHILTAAQCNLGYC